MKKYAIYIHWLEGECAWFAYHPEFGRSACSFIGDSISETLEGLDKTRADVIEYYK